MYNCRSFVISDLPGLTRRDNKLTLCHYVRTKRSGLCDHTELIWAVLSHYAGGTDSLGNLKLF
jgi:hypothetical protein